MQGYVELYVGLDLRYKVIRLTPGSEYRARVKVGVSAQYLEHADATCIQSKLTTPDMVVILACGYT